MAWSFTRLEASHMTHRSGRPVSAAFVECRARVDLDEPPVDSTSALHLLGSWVPSHRVEVEPDA